MNKTKINFKFIDLGGGMGIAYSKKEKEINLKKYAKLIQKFMKNKNSKIIFEPGRFIIGNAAILITKIIYIKKSNNKNFIILDAGMNNLMRPALYNSYHEIIPIKKTNKLLKGNFQFVGPICESSDKFSNKKFIILDAGMNDLMRPALYDAQHQIIPLKKTNYLKVILNS